ncbi:MAG: ABC transporter [Microbacterium sp.]
MSNPTSSHGEPVEEPTTVDDDIVVRAQEGLADAEAARVEEPVVVEETVVVEEPDPWDTPEAATLAYEPAAEAETTVYEPVVTPSEPVVETPVVAAAPVIPAPSPIFVQAPEAPRPRGNRAAAGAIGLLAAVCFAVLYLATALGFGAIQGVVTGENVGSAALTALGTWGLWVPTVVFFIAFWLLGAIINRGRWGVWVVTGLIVGVAAYAGHILGQLFEAPFWTLTASEGETLVEGQLLAPLAIAAFVFGRELTIWFGAWAAARGKRVTEINVEAQREYERTLEAGPQLVRA